MSPVSLNYTILRNFISFRFIGENENFGKHGISQNKQLISRNNEIRFASKSRNMCETNFRWKPYCSEPQVTESALHPPYLRRNPRSRIGVTTVMDGRQENTCFILSKTTSISPCIVHTSGLIVIITVTTTFKLLLYRIYIIFRCI
jgi:hypothetical protein